MIRYKYINNFILIIILVIISANTYSQHYFIRKVKLNPKNDNQNIFGPSLHNGYLYYCSDKKINTVNSFENEDGRRYSDIYKVSINTNKLNSEFNRLDTVVNSKLNEGPIEFFNNSNNMCLSRNIEESNSDTTVSNKIGIVFFSINEDIISLDNYFKYNSQEYNIAHPTISENDSLMIFVSDMPGNYGSSDLYESRYINGEWSEPINLGETINTKNKETFPFLYKNELYFTSEREDGMGGLDIYKSVLENSVWSKPELLPFPINSVNDDFSVYMLHGNKEGYITSNRKWAKQRLSNVIETKDNIFYFKMNLPEPSEYFEVNPDFCFKISDEEYDNQENIELIWDLGDGNIKEGNNITHCYSNIGNYIIKLSIKDDNIDTIVSNIDQYNINVSTNNLPFIETKIINDNMLIFANFEGTNTEYNEFYWKIDDQIYYDKWVIVSADVKDINYITWNNKFLKTLIGIKKQNIK